MTTRSDERAPLKFGARGKRRTPGQRIGRQGQLIFERWAVDQNLTANSCPDDFGVDYFCQVLSSSSESHTTEEVRGETIAVQVRAALGSSRVRIRMDKVDAEAALRIEAPYLLVGVDVARNAVFYRFLDIDFAERLAAFIAGENDELTLALKPPTFQTDGLRSAILQHCRPGVQHRLRIRCTEICIERDIPGARLHIAHESTTSSALVSVPWISSMFEVNTESEEHFRSWIFERGQMPPPGTKGVVLQPSLLRALDVAGTDRLLIRGTFQYDVTATIRLGDEQETLPFHARAAGDDLAFVCKCGLVLSVSGRMPDSEGRYVHKLELALSKEYARSLATFGEYDAALRLLKPGATITFENASGGFDIGAWGNALEHMGDDYEGMLSACTFARIDLSTIFLADLVDDEFGRSISVLAALAKGTTVSSLVPSFVIGPAAESDEQEDFWKLSGFDLPIVMNLKSQGVVVWIRGKGHIYVDTEGTLCGFSPSSQVGIRVTVRPRRFTKASPSPEAWICKTWPAINVLEDPSRTGTFSFKGPSNHELEASFFPLDTP